MEIKNIFGEVLFALDTAKTIAELVTAAVAAKKSLSRANLRDADLSRADLSGADMLGAYLSGADLSGANLSRADLSGADLHGANLSGANLRGADLRGADLRGADLRRAGLDGVPAIEKIHQTVYAAASQPNALNMGSWHTCDTTHCRAGWVIALAGAGGRALEWAIGTPAAATVIYLKSDPKLEKVPDFYASNENALADMKRLAEQEAANG
jgi:uncharacterized protein YjbI with pentapeptide repeats